MLSPDRLNAFVFSGFAGIALLIAVVGVAGVLAFSVSARTREFGVRLAVGSTPRNLLLACAVGGNGHGCRSASRRAPSGGFAFARVAASYLGNDRDAGHPADGRRCGRAHRGGGRRVADAGGARVARGSRAGAPERMIVSSHEDTKNTKSLFSRAPDGTDCSVAAAMARIAGVFYLLNIVTGALALFFVSGRLLAPSPSLRFATSWSRCSSTICSSR